MITAWGINNWGGEEVSEHDDRERERDKTAKLGNYMLTLDGLDVYIIACTTPPTTPHPPSCWGGPFQNYPFRGDWTKGGTC